MYLPMTASGLPGSLRLVGSLNKRDTFPPYNSDRTMWMGRDLDNFIATYLTKERCRFQFACFGVTQKEIGISTRDKG